MGQPNRDCWQSLMGSQDTIHGCRGSECDGVCMNLDCVHQTSTEIARHNRKLALNNVVSRCMVPLGVLMLTAAMMTAVVWVATYPARHFKESMSRHRSAGDYTIKR